jgi:hypothetical protein
MVGAREHLLPPDVSGLLFPNPSDKIILLFICVSSPLSIYTTSLFVVRTYFFIIFAASSNSSTTKQEHINSKELGEEQKNNGNDRQTRSIGY